MVALQGEEADPPLAASSTSTILPSTSTATPSKALATYRDHFVIKRGMQVEMTEDMLGKREYERRFALAKVALDAIFKVLRKAQRNITGVDEARFGTLPADNKTLAESLILIWENTAFLGDILLRMPDISHQLIDSYPVRMEVARWAILVCLRSDVFVDVHRQQLLLMQQELKIAETPDPNYTNPYSEDHMLSEQVSSVVEVCLVRPKCTPPRWASHDRSVRG